MSDHKKCETCGGNESVPCSEADEGQVCGEGHECPTCCRVVSVEAAEIAVAVKEIETEGLIAERHMIALPGDAARMRWTVYQRNSQINVGYGDSISAALAAHRQEMKP